MAAAAITITESRSEVVDFTAPFYSEPYAILIYKPKNVNKLWNALLVFNSQSWVAILGSAVAVVFTTYLIHKFAAKPANTGFEQVGGCVWYVTAGMVNQGKHLHYCIIHLHFTRNIFLCSWRNRTQCLVWTKSFSFLVAVRCSNYCNLWWTLGRPIIH